jgi:hypothetical protein
MDTYQLKDKIQITKDFLSDLEAKSWQEIDHLQNQIANIESTKENNQIIQLLKNLLTSYYVFAGGLENMSSEAILDKPVTIEEPIKMMEPATMKIPMDNDEKLVLEIPVDDFEEPAFNTDTKGATVEPFEYFVDFDEPSGEPLSDEDLYG